MVRMSARGTDVYINGTRQGEGATCQRMALGLVLIAQAKVRFGAVFALRDLYPASAANARTALAANRHIACFQHFQQAAARLRVERLPGAAHIDLQGGTAC